jgi:putative serine protease PepD
MSDSNDPFAAQPYIPPSQRDTDSPRPSAPVQEAPPAPAERTEPEPATEQVEPAAASSTTEQASSTHEMAAVDDRSDDDREPTVVLPTEADDDGAPPPRGRRRVAGTLALVVLAAGAGMGGAVAYDAIRGDDTGVVSSLDAGSDAGSAPAGDVEKVAQRLLPSVTQINVAGGGQAGSGTGIIISSDGQILTNNHVVESAADGGSITVAFNDGSNAKAEILGRDAVTDLAVIKAEGKSGLQPATLGSSADLKVGQEVVAIGSPFGLESTVTSGIISALNRPVRTGDATGTETASTVIDAIQTDAAINPGNSGGPLVNMNGEVVGINSAIASLGASAGGQSGSIGLGFSIPIDQARTIATQLIDSGSATHAQLGVSVRDASTNGSSTFSDGAAVAAVSAGGAAEKAGLAAGDVITKVGDRAVDSADALIAAIRTQRPGDKVVLTYTHNGKEATAQVTLGSDASSS